MNRKEFFELLGAPLNNYQWPWGAARQEDGTVFLCVWEDEVRAHVSFGALKPAIDRRFKTSQRQLESCSAWLRLATAFYR